MRAILCLTLLGLVGIGCGSDAGSSPDAQVVDVKPDASADAPVLDRPEVPDVPAIPPDGPSIDTTPPVVSDPPHDAAPSILDGPVIDGKSTIVDVPAHADHPEPDVPVAQPIDAPALDARPRDAMTVTWPDGRVFTVVEVCQLGSLPDDDRCPATYAEALAKAQTVDASWPAGISAGRCSEGGYVYYPYYSTSSILCYYGPDTQELIGTGHSSDVLEPCRGDTVSRLFVSGTKPPCTSITWEVYRLPY